VIKSLIKKMIPQSVINNFYKFKYRGNEVWCPCCEQSFREFIPYGERKNAVCPNCHSFERHRLLWLYLQQKTNLLTDELKVFHVAPEASFTHILKSQSNLDYLSVDLVSPLAMEKIDITDIPHPNENFDVILCNHVLEHINDDAKAMRELYRILKPNGWAIIQSPLDYNLTQTYEDFTIDTEEGRKKAFGQEDHVRIYGQDYEQKLQQQGFIVQVDTFVQGFSKPEQYRYGVMEDEFIYLCRK